MQLYSGPLRARRPGEWTAASAILFIVTLAARGSVTLAARAAGMSRKSAYALRKRDPHFAEAWKAARTAASQGRSPRGTIPADGNNGIRAPASISSSGSLGRKGTVRSGIVSHGWRDHLFEELRPISRDSPLGGTAPRLAPRPASR